MAETTYYQSPPERRGSKYQSGQSLKDVAAAVRADIKAAVKAGELPKGLAVSVRTEYYAGGCSLHVTVRKAPYAIQTGAYLAMLVEAERTKDWNNFSRGPRVEQYTERAKEVLETLEGLVWAYNRDATDSQVDYFNRSFYEHVKHSHDLERAEVDSEVAQMAARAARVAAEVEKAKDQKLLADAETLATRLEAAKAEIAAEQYAAGVAAGRATEDAKRQSPEYLAGVAAAKAEAPKELTGWEKRVQLLEVD